MNGDATGDKERAVDGANDFEGGDLGGRTGERVAAVGAGVRDEDAGLGERLEYLGKELRRDVVGVRDGFGRGCAGDGLRCGGAARLLGKILEGHEAVVRFFGEPQHRCEGGNAPTGRRVR